MRPVKSASPAVIAALQDAYKKVSGQTAASDDARVLATGILEATSQKATNFTQSLSSVHDLPFADTYRALLSDLQQLAGHKRDWVVSSAETLPDRFDGLLKPLQAMAAFATEPASIKIYAEANELLTTLADDVHLTPDGTAQLNELRNLLADEKCYESDSPRLIKQLTRRLKRAIDETLADARGKAKAGIKAFAEGLFAQYYAEATEENRTKAQGIVDAATAAVDTQHRIRVVRGAVEDFKATYAQQLIELGRKPEPSSGGGNGGTGSGMPSGNNGGKQKTVSYAKVCKPRNYTAATLSSNKDVDDFVEALRASLKEHIGNDEIIYL